MKKFYIASLAALGLMLGACSDEIESPVVPGNDGSVTFTAQLPAGLASRAFNEGTNATNLSYAVYKSGTEAPEVVFASGDAAAPAAVYDADTKSFKLSLNLVKGQTYDFVFWADAYGNAEGAPYKFDASNQTVELSYTDVEGNDDKRDAFFTSIAGLTVTGAMQKNVELRRPFAQLNIGTDDIETAKAAKIEHGSTTVTVADVYGKLDLFTGVASEPVEGGVTFKAHPSTDETFPVTHAEETKVYSHLSMNYLLTGAVVLEDDVNSAQKETSDVTITFADVNGKQINEFKLSAVPFQRNYRTNIYGSLLTSQVDLDIEIVPGFGDPDYDSSTDIVEPKKDDSGTYLVKTEGELRWIAKQVNSGNRLSGSTFSLQNDIYLVDTWTPIGGGGLDFGYRFTGKFLGNGHTIYNMKVNAVDRAGFFGFFNGQVEDLNFDNAHVTSNHWGGVVAGYSDNETGSTYIKNCTVSNSSVTLATEINNKGEWDNGDKAGMIIGYMATRDQVTGCTVTDCVIQGYRDLGGIIGYANGSVISGNSVNGLTIYVDNSHNYKNYTILGTGGNDANGVIGEKNTSATDTDNTAVNVTIVGLVADGVVMDAEGNYVISKPEGLVWMSQNIIGEKFRGKIFKLDADIDMAGVDYAPCGKNIAAYPSTAFYGTFDGQGHTISNLTASDNYAEFAAAGLFGTAAVATIRNVNLTNVNITSTHYAGAICGYTSGGTIIENCTVDGGSVVSAPEFLKDKWSNGDKAGGIIGYASGKTENTIVSGCSVKNISVQAYRDFGGIAGTINDAPQVLNNTVENIKLMIDNSHNYNNFATQEEHFAGEVIGHFISGVNQGNSATNVEIGYAPVAE